MGNMNIHITAKKKKKKWTEHLERMNNARISQSVTKYNSMETECVRPRIRRCEIRLGL
jgi:hypothetical protein